MKKITSLLLILFITATGCFFTSCKTEKNITVIAREQGSGTREAFDNVVTDGNGNYLEMKTNGKKVYKTTSAADLQKETGNVISKVASDKNAIGYISLGSASNTVKILKINGVMPSAETVLNGDYVIKRPFVIMTSSTVTLTEITADFLNYLKSTSAEKHAKETGYIWLFSPESRANEGEGAIPVIEYEAKASLPSDGKIIINGSSSMEKFIKKAMLGYASIYGKTADEIFTLDLQGSSVGKKAVTDDKNGNVIGLSSASVTESGIDSFNICLDAIAVIVNKENEFVNDITVSQLYDIYSGKITKYAEFGE